MRINAGKTVETWGLIRIKFDGGKGYAVLHLPTVAYRTKYQLHFTQNKSGEVDLKLRTDDYRIF